MGLNRVSGAYIFLKSDCPLVLPHLMLGTLDSVFSFPFSHQTEPARYYYREETL